LRLASFNVENLTVEPDAAAPLAARLDILRPQLERLAADVLCLQEVDATKGGSGGRELKALEILLKETSSRWPIRRSAQYANDLVRTPAYERATVVPPDRAPTPIHWDRPILHAEIDLPSGGTLHVVNMHLRAPLAAFVPGQKTGPFSWKSVTGWAEGYFLAAVKRAGQALEARMLVDRLFDQDPSALIVVAGDFNAEEREVPLRIIVGDAEDTGSGALTHRALVVLEHSLPENQRFTVIHRGQHLMLDHLLVSRQLLSRYRGIEIHNEALGDELVAYTLIDAAPDSYHAPIVARFEFA
jgi:endonuclease/exonuclease/phosphatase family metal-dependent hydrolase